MKFKFSVVSHEVLLSDVASYEVLLSDRPSQPHVVAEVKELDLTMCSMTMFLHRSLFTF